MKKFNEDETKKAIELLTTASGFIDVIRFEEGEEVDEDNIEGEINKFLDEVTKRQNEPDFRIEVGKENCLNDIPVYLGRTLPEIKDKLDYAFYEKDYKAMAEQIERLKRVTKDFEDMVHELGK